MVRSTLHVTVFKEEVNCLAGTEEFFPTECQCGRSAGVTLDIDKITSLLLGRWIYWETFTVTWYCVPGSIVREREQRK